MVEQQKEHFIADYLYKNKFLIIKEIVNIYRERIGCPNKCTHEIIEALTAEFIKRVRDNKRSDKELAVIVRTLESYRQGMNILLEDLLSFFKDVRLKLENKINNIEKLKSDQTFISLFNLIFIDIQKEMFVIIYNDQQEEIEKKNQELKKLQQDRLQLLSKLSNSFAHEIRNPLTSIKGFVQLLESRIDKPANERKYFKYINQEIKDLEEQVNQILYLSNRKNHHDFQVSKLSLNDLVFEALSTFQPIFEEHEIQFNIEIKKQIVIHGVRDQLKLALYKIIHNAVDALLLIEKNREINLKLGIQNRKVMLTISNNGPPIPRLIESKIFDPFVSTKELGKGIGLPITKQIIEKHNGTVKWWSHGEWTSFSILLPYKESK
ncbi:sensor histidine kinase [Evansella cellulosilytica]|uniref:histidine kinase n=1 Tax=Evansella cellulosilytica (strain ATCC 21833 / DSM 2522 / FERM P-1141 / JCM 9156 / N-4) TaxID=649639 RepID=E6TV61_EVAC2|nr:histidine kinase dimerization/phospho-acceptor domain-containing protein [Evansella cellulosilytica]ADU29745.1 histidine kinase [Evansella cellulosilytica DSM 2522]